MWWAGKRVVGETPGADFHMPNANPPPLYVANHPRHRLPQHFRDPHAGYLPLDLIIIQQRWLTDSFFKEWSPSSHNGRPMARCEPRKVEQKGMQSIDSSLRSSKR